MPRRTVRQGLEREMGTDPGLDIGRIQRQTEIVSDIRGGWDDIDLRVVASRLRARAKRKIWEKCI